MQTAEQLIYDYRESSISPSQKMLCDYAVKLTLQPGKMDEKDVILLREAGYSDEQISLGTQVISYFNYINRIADGLGVDDESWMTTTHEEWKRRKGRFE